MHIAWQYLDKLSAALCALKDYESMNHILSHSEAERIAIREHMEGIPSSLPSAIPRGARNPRAGEDRLISGLDKMNELAARRQQAQAYMDWFQPAWDALSEEERYVLSQFYQREEGRQTDGLYEICDRFHIERSSAYKKKDRALAHLTVLLYGR